MVRCGRDLVCGAGAPPARCPALQVLDARAAAPWCPAAKELTEEQDDEGVCKGGRIHVACLHGAAQGLEHAVLQGGQVAAPRRPAAHPPPALHRPHNEADAKGGQQDGHPQVPCGARGQQAGGGGWPRRACSRRPRHGGGCHRTPQALARASPCAVRTGECVHEGPQAGGRLCGRDQDAHAGLARGKGEHSAGLRRRERGAAAPSAADPARSSCTLQRPPRLLGNDMPAWHRRKQPRGREHRSRPTSRSSVLTGMPVTTMSQGPSGSFRDSVLRRGRQQRGALGPSVGCSWADPCAARTRSSQPLSTFTRACRPPPPPCAPPASRTSRPSPCTSS